SGSSCLGTLGPPNRRGQEDSLNVHRMRLNGCVAAWQLAAERKDPDLAPYVLLNSAISTGRPRDLHSAVNAYLPTARSSICEPAYLLHLSTKATTCVGLGSPAASAATRRSQQQ